MTKAICIKYQIFLFLFAGESCIDDCTSDIQYCKNGKYDALFNHLSLLVNISFSRGISVILY